MSVKGGGGSNDEDNNDDDYVNSGRGESGMMEEPAKVPTKGVRRDVGAQMTGIAMLRTMELMTRMLGSM